ncbi:hypothetical protein Vretifemale_10916, partial [Volvox reticuliferus]
MGVPQLVYAYPPSAPAGSTRGFVKSFSSLIVTVRGALDSICGEKTRLIHLEHGGQRLLLASAHLESVMLVLALRSVVPHAAATSLALHLAETLVLLLGPYAEWGLTAGGPSSLSPGPNTGPREETRAILDRIFGGVLSQVDSPTWMSRMAPWTSFEPSCLRLTLPAHMHTRLVAFLSDHGAQRNRAPFSFFRKHSCLMYRGLILASNLQPSHTRQLWQLLWALGLHQHSGGLPCQVLTHTIHLPQLQLQPPGGPAAAATEGGGRGVSLAAASAAGNAAAAAAAAAVALQAESEATVSEQRMGRSLLVVAAALRLVLVVVLTGYDEEIEEELAGRLEGHSAAELLQRVHTGMGAELERLVEGSAIYSGAARALESPSPVPPQPPTPPHQIQRPDSGASGMGMGWRPGKLQGGVGGSFASGGSLLFRVITRNRSSPAHRSTSSAGGAPWSAGTGDGGQGRGGGGGAGSTASAEATSFSPSGPPLALSRSPQSLQTRPAQPLRIALSTSLPPGPPIALTTARLPHTPNTNTTGGDVPPAGQPHDRGASASAPALGSRGPGPADAGASSGGAAGGSGEVHPVMSPFEGVLLVIAHDGPQGSVRFLGDVPRGGGGGGGGGGEMAVLAAVWRAVAVCRGRFGLHNVAVAAPPKHARLTMTLDQILQLSAARSNKLGGQRLGAADSTPWQYHPELASLAAVNTVTLRLQLPPGFATHTTDTQDAVTRGPGEGAAGMSSPFYQQQQQQQRGSVAVTTTSPAKPSWLTRISGHHRASSASAHGDSPAGTSTPAAAAASPEPSTPVSGLLPVWSGIETLSMSQGQVGTGPHTGTNTNTNTTSNIPLLAASPSPPSLYLTGLLLPDTRELYLCHTAEVDEARLAE